MSVRAYRVKEIVTEESDSFNLWHNDILMDWLDKGGWLESLDEGCGLLDIPIEVLQEALTLPHLESYTIEALTRDIKSSDNGWVRYYCY